ncbi:hypothetical protein SP15_252 [Bacillus phage SP-15]|uniref:Uncharacterized protein n=1 Tax=Bacillus phage SP-15 TaxID=1792032 RepID=A0A127AWM2_9CAUD|nr:hypothetical protein SP15_252 [Bacillus phage SP-15]AMM45058.1 hypothetical protein SP15_252 [Bacillus phage SP-15]
MEIHKLEIGEPLQLERLTAMIGHLSSEVLVFENSYELHKFKSVCELISEHLEYQNIDDESEDISILVDEMEQEAYMIDEVEDYSSRVLKITRRNMLTEGDIHVSVYYGVLNSGDSYLERDHVRNMYTHLKRWSKDGNGLPATKRMIGKIAEFLGRNIGPSDKIVIEIDKVEESTRINRESKI